MRKGFVLSDENEQIEDDQAFLGRLQRLEERVVELEAASAQPAPLKPQPSQLPQPPPPRSASHQPPPPTWGPSSARQTPAGSTTSSAASTTQPVTTDVLLKWAGLGLLFLAAMFLLSTAISRGWIGPRMQLTFAVLGGLALIGSGLKLRSAPGWTTPLVQVGVAILFVCSGASWSWLDLGSPVASAVICFGIALGTVGLARYLNEWTIALVALVGLIWIPTWVGLYESVGVGWSFVFLLAVLGLFTLLYLEQHWSLLWVMSVLATALFVLGDAHNVSRGEDESALVRMGLVLVLALTYWFAPVVSAMIRKQSLMSHEFRVALFVPVWFWSSITDFESMSDSGVALVGAVVAVGAALSAVLTRGLVSRAFFIIQCLGASIMASVCLVYVLDGSVLLLAFALQTACLVGLVRHVDDVWFAVQAGLSAVIVGLFAGIWILTAAYQDLAITEDVINLIVIALLVLLSLLDMRWYRANVSASQAGVGPGGIGLVVAYGATLWWVVGVLVHLNHGQALITAVWSLIAVGVIATALTYRSNQILRLGLLTLILVVAKLLTVDLAQVDVFVRVALFFVIGLGLLALSYRLPRLMAPSAGSSKVDP